MHGNTSRIMSAGHTPGTSRSGTAPATALRRSISRFRLRAIRLPAIKMTVIGPRIISFRMIGLLPIKLTATWLQAIRLRVAGWLVTGLLPIGLSVTGPLAVIPPECGSPSPGCAAAHYLWTFCRICRDAPQSADNPVRSDRDPAPFFQKDLSSPKSGFSDSQRPPDPAE